jgi:hypothetical protein
MARNGSGTYTNPYPNFVSGTVISSTEVDTNNSQIATALTQSIAVDGQSVVTQDIPLATHKFTAMKDGNALTDSLSLGQAQAEAFVWCGTAGGSADAITLSPAPGITAYAAGQRFVWMASASTNTTATTVAISGLTPIALQDNGVALTAGQHAAGKMFMAILNTTSTAQLMQVQVSGTDPLIVTSLTVTGDATIGDDLTLLSDAAVLGFGVDTDVTLTHVHDTGLLLNSTMALQFNDASQYINAPTATVLDINATDEIELNATTIDVNGELDVSGDLSLTTDTAAVNFGVDSDVTLTHVHDSGLSLSAGANFTTLELISTEDSSAGGPFLFLNKDSASAANNDYIGEIRFDANNNAPERVTYARMFTRINDVADGSEDGGFYIQVMRAGALDSAIIIDDDEVWLGGTKGVTIDGGNLTFSTAAKGVHLGVTSATASNLLDDYEEGTFTATFIGSTTAPSTAVTATGVYTKIGNFVNASVYFANKNTTGISGYIQVTGMPFVNSGHVTVGTYLSSYLHSTGDAASTAYLAAGGGTAQMLYGRDNASWSAATARVSTGGYFVLNMGYSTA